MKFTLITGASSGIGLCYAEQFAAKGENIIVVSNQKERNEEVAAELKQRFGVEAVALYADLSKADSAEQIYEWCKERNYEVSTLVSNAGILQFGMFLHTKPSMAEFITNLHCVTPSKLCRLFGEDMCSRGEGRILIMSSMTAWTPYITVSYYAATKAYLKSFAQSLWYEFRPYGVRVTTVYPGAVDTPLYSLEEKHRKWLRTFGVMMSAERLAKSGIRALERGRRTAIPGLFTKIVVLVCRILPAHALLPILKIPVIKRILAKL
ncbi:MAG: SDR family NAD(P)-dependent oxidoreductase [Alistipes sp.]|nr:SDR family NAD(P)-dependent oxidoreductase [Alistipes sp.]